jgi:hypothetical protein
MKSPSPPFFNNTLSFHNPPKLDADLRNPGRTPHLPTTNISRPPRTTLHQIDSKVIHPKSKKDVNMIGLELRVR